MGWSYGENSEGRDVGYGVPAYCDHAGCKAKIDRGLGYICGGEPGGGEYGCGMFVCSEHTYANDKCLQLCRHCSDRRHTRLVPSPDHPEWMRWKLTDESWQQWRDENPAEVEKLRVALDGGGPAG
jgi:hypothetical protein